MDVELALNLQPAGLSDDLGQTVDYSRVFETCRQIVESTRFNLVEALAEAIAHELLAGFPADEVTVRVRKPAVKLGGTLRAAGVEIRRRRRRAEPGRTGRHDDERAARALRTARRSARRRTPARSPACARGCWGASRARRPA